MSERIAALPVPAVNIRYGEVATFLGRTAMNDDFFYLTHDIAILNE